MNSKLRFLDSCSVCHLRCCCNNCARCADLADLFSGAHTIHMIHTCSCARSISFLFALHRATAVPSFAHFARSHSVPHPRRLGGSSSDSLPSFWSIWSGPWNRMHRMPQSAQSGCSAKSGSLPAPCTAKVQGWSLRRCWVRRLSNGRYSAWLESVLVGCMTLSLLDLRQRHRMPFAARACTHHTLYNLTIVKYEEPHPSKQQAICWTRRDIRLSVLKH